MNEESLLDKFNDMIDEILKSAQETLRRAEYIYFIAQIEATSTDFLDMVANESSKGKQAVEYVRSEMQKVITEMEANDESTQH